MPRPKRKKKSGPFSFFKLKAKTKKRLVRLSLFFNLTVLILLVLAVQRQSPATVFQNTLRFFSVPFQNIHLPKISRPISKKAIPSAASPRMLSAGKPKIVIVLDDMGHTMNDRDSLRALGRDVTYAILPHLTYSRYFAILSQETGAEVILHQPFEASDGTIPGPGLITDRMPESQSLAVLRHGLDSVPNHRGVNNHMGSRGTSDPALMGPILQELKRRNLFFLDSMTSSKSVAYPMARQMGLPALKRDVFLDNVDDTAAIRGQLQKLVKIARQKGYAVGIGHYHPKTLVVLRSDIPALKAAGLELVSLQELILFLEKN